MAAASATISELDHAGRLVATYVQTPAPLQLEGKNDKRPSNDKWRVDVIRPEAVRYRPVWEDVLATFMPVGYPNSVTADYLPYQIYDSLQAFSSAIAGLISARAVLEGVGVGDANATPTAALLLSILQESAGRVATILFAHRFGTALEPECKRYRLAADVLNDTAMIVKCVSPAFPKAVRVILLSAASVLEALCGVAAGSSKASLSAHFAKQGNLGEVNAKDASQETVISLMGMLAGSVIVPRVSSMWATWTTLIFLLLVHISTNYLAVRAVTMRCLNRHRASIFFNRLIEQGQVLTPQEVAVQERIFVRGSALFASDGHVLGACKFGASIQDLLRFTAQPRLESGASHALNFDLSTLLNGFKDEEYILWYSNQNATQVLIILKQNAVPISHLLAWLHASLLVRQVNASESRKQEGTTMDRYSDLVSRSRDMARELLSKHKQAIESAGWDLNVTALETRPGLRAVLD
ncbi:MAG: hypothetical protein M1828_007117 [Chrysothrix sp. TS-e1954]|nr:MAG: hypothetical protein M1828_007117 [Chrysothrix sp. TS-e1954]